MNRKVKLKRSLVYRMGMLRGALLERIRIANDLLHDADKLEALAVDQSMEQDGVEAALYELEALAGVGAKAGKNAEVKTG